MKLNKDLREFIVWLNSTTIKHLIVGGHAVAFHGYPRFTGDIGFLVERTPENAVRLEKIVAEFGFANLGLTAKDFLEPGIVVQLGRPPNRIDLLTSIDGVEFAEAWPNRVPADLDGEAVTFIGRQELLKNKRASGRPQDAADLAKLEE